MKLGYGIGVILMNIGMYFVLPYVIWYYIKKVIRTRRLLISNWAVISNCRALSVLKTSLFGLIVLLVMSVSVSTAFVESAYADDHEPIRIILDITHENILDSLAACEGEDCEIAQDLLEL